MDVTLTLKTIAPKKEKAISLFVGSREGYKNFPNACLAFERTAAIDSDCSFAVVGSPPNRAMSSNGLKSLVPAFGGFTISSNFTKFVCRISWNALCLKI